MMGTIRGAGRSNDPVRRFPAMKMPRPLRGRRERRAARRERSVKGKLASRGRHQQWPIDGARNPPLGPGGP